MQVAKKTIGEKKKKKTIGEGVHPEKAATASFEYLSLASDAKARCKNLPTLSCLR